MLTEAVRRRPYQVVLFDEIEKAHPDVFNVLLQVLDDGRLTDGQGRTVDFRNTLIILTSNLGSRISWSTSRKARTRRSGARAGDGRWCARTSGPNSSTASTRSSCSTGCRRARWAAIVEIQLGRLQKLLEDRKIALDLDAAARDWLADKGYDPVYGARPLKRVIQRNVQDPLAEMILAGAVKDGDRVAISAEGGVLTFNGKPPHTAEIEPFDAPVPKRMLN